LSNRVYQLISEMRHSEATTEASTYLPGAAP
jgi:hypothetical protein